MTKNIDRIDNCACDVVNIEITPRTELFRGQWHGVAIISDASTEQARLAQRNFFGQAEVEIYKSGVLIGSAWITAFNPLGVEDGKVKAHVLFEGIGLPMEASDDV